MALAAPVINPGSSTITNDPTPTFTGTAEAGSTVELFADGSSLGTTTTDSNGNWSFTVPASAALSDGSSAITAIATDASGNASTSSAALSLTVDSSAPTFTSGGSATVIDENSGADQIIYTAAATDNSSVTYSLKANNKDDAASFSINNTTGEVTLNVDPDYETQSAYTFTVIASDAAGNTSEKSVSLAINAINQPLDDDGPSCSSRALSASVQMRRPDDFSTAIN